MINPGAIPTELKLVVLFGSRARGDWAASSDWDLGVVFKPNSSNHPLRDCQLDLPLANALGVNPDAVQVIDLKRSTPLLQRNVAREGKPLFEATPGDFADYCSLALRQWADWQERQQICVKLEHLRELLKLLRAEAQVSEAAFLADRRQQLVVERLLHLLIEASSDLLEHLLVQTQGIRPESFTTCFLDAGRHGLISSELALELAPAAGLRNRLVHDYDRLDPRRIHAAMAVALEQISRLEAELTQRMGI